jgi:endogenous inhibitor of DNA gyrase (YacG/DUF329 family)
MTEPIRLLRCPTCRKPVRFTLENRYRPFCSDRCRLIDLGDWANEQRRISTDEQPNDESER